MGPYLDTSRPIQFGFIAIVFVFHEGGQQGQSRSTLNKQHAYYTSRLTQSTPLMVMLMKGAHIPFQRAPLFGYTVPVPPLTLPWRFGSAAPLAFLQLAIDEFLIQSSISDPLIHRYILAPKSPVTRMDKGAPREPLRASSALALTPTRFESSRESVPSRSPRLPCL